MTGRVNGIEALAGDMTRSRSARRWVVTAVVAAAVLALLTRPGAAHGGTLRLSGSSPQVPFWLVSLTGGGVIGVSFLFAALVTDHDLIRDVAATGRRLGAIPASLTGLARAAGVAGFVVVVAVGLVGPSTPTANLAVLAIWVGWWAGFTALTYLAGNAWPAINPWRTLAALLPAGDRRVSPRAATAISVGGLLALVYLEVLSPLSEDPVLLVAAVLAYSLATLAGAVVVGDGWFERVDPISRVFRLYGRIAPIQRTGDGLRLSLPGAELTRPPATDPRPGERAGSAADPQPAGGSSRADGGTAAARSQDRGAWWARREGDATFVVALLWVTTFDGLVSTAAWETFARAAVGVGVPAHALYVAVLLVGFGVFLVGYRLACRLSRRTGNSYVSVPEIRVRFAPSLLPIAAGYHLAHYLDYLLSLLPSLAVVATDPLSPPASLPVLTLPGWFGGVGLLAIVAGHVLAVAVAHAVAFETFTGRLQPIRSQYPFILVMVLYTTVSLWLVSQPTVEPPFV